jgi:hypothetical protein
MSERKVNLRVSAIGGDKFKAELRSIGKEGQHALSLIEGSSGGASTGLHATGLAADQLMQRLSSLSARAAQAANSLGSFGSTGNSVMSQINASTGVTGGMRRDSADIEAYGRALDELRAKYNPLFAEERRHSESIAEINRAYKVGALSLDEWSAATARETEANARSVASLKARQIAQENLTNTTLRSTIDENTGVTGVSARSTEDIEAYGRALDATRAKYNPMYAAISKYRASLAEVRAAHSAGAISADEMTAAISRLRQASLADIAVIKGRNSSYQAMNKQGGLARNQMIQMTYQLNDIGVSLASGQNPLIVMIQQGAQIAQIYGGQGGVNAAFSQMRTLIGKIPAPLAAVGAAIAVGAVAIKGMQSEINETSDVTVSFGDTALAVWQLISEGVWTYIEPAATKIGEWFSAAWDLVAAGMKWLVNSLIKDVQSIVLAFTSLPGIISGEFQRIVDIGAAAFDGLVSIWGLLPTAIGDFAFKAAATMVDAVESMLNWVGERINSFIDKLNSALALLPDWATGGSGLSIGKIGRVDLIDVKNPYAGQADLLADPLKKAGQAIMDAATQPNEAWNEYGAGIAEITNSDPTGDYFNAVSARAQQNARNRQAGENTDQGGGGAASAQEKDAVLSDLEEIQKALNDYAEAAGDYGKQIGEAMSGAFSSAEDALVEFVETGKLDISSLVTSIISDFARIGIRGAITSPLASLTSGVVGSLGLPVTSAFVQHGGGPAGSGPMRQVSAANFVNAPRLHDGTGAVGLRSDEYAAVLQSGERVLNRQETRNYQSQGNQPLVVNFNGVRDANSFRQSRTQITSDLARAVSMGQRGI